jgi:hypothetical protein
MVDCGLRPCPPYALRFIQAYRAALCSPLPLRKRMPEGQERGKINIRPLSPGLSPSRGERRKSLRAFASPREIQLVDCGLRPCPPYALRFIQAYRAAHCIPLPLRERMPEGQERGKQTFAPLSPGLSPSRGERRKLLRASAGKSIVGLRRFAACPTYGS